MHGGQGISIFIFFSKYPFGGISYTLPLLGFQFRFFCLFTQTQPHKNQSDPNKIFVFFNFSIHLIWGRGGVSQSMTNYDREGGGGLTNSTILLWIWINSDWIQPYMIHISCISKEYFKHISCISKEHFKHISGISQAYLSHISAISKSQVYLRHISSLSQLYFRYISTISQAYLCHISGISEANFRHIWCISWSYLRPI